MAAPALVALAHGSRDPRAAATIKALVDEVRSVRPDLKVEAAFLETSRPTFQTVVDRLVRAGHDEVVVVPLLLTEAHHATVDVPAAVAEATARHPHVRIQTTGVLGLEPCFLQVLVLLTPLGMEIGGNRNWLKIGGFTLQPSEAIKLGLVIWLGVVLARKKDMLGDWRHVAVPVVPVAGAAIGVVVLGGDLGTTMIMAALVLGALYFAGVKLRYLLTGVAGVAVLAFFVAISSQSRLGRIAALFGGSSAVNPDVTWQIDNGYYALASGGVFGVGLGNSHSKWSWLPAADTDFIFAIIGEELGLIGAVVVLLLFVMLAIVFLRIIHASTDPFPRITTAAVMVWLIGQAFVNIAVVLGVIPVLGVPLPLISAGGTAMIFSMIAIGIVLSFARQNAKDARRAKGLDA